MILLVHVLKTLEIFTVVLRLTGQTEFAAYDGEGDLCEL